MAHTPTELTIAEAAALLADRALSPVELVQAHLDRIAAVDPQINSYITLTAEAALEQARAAEAEIAAGAYRGALHGIPIALKDLYETAGVRTTAGTRILADNIPAADGVCVARLRAAGAISLGKLNMHEWALGITNINPHYGAVTNPWDTSRMTGGSSGGSGAALAARLCMGSLGSDTGGSIRIPASLCGVVGLKPTYGRVSVRGVIPLSWNLDHAGPMARTVRDTALLLSVIAGYDPNDPGSANMPVDDYLGSIDAGVRGMRIGMPTDAHFSEADAPILAAVEAAAELFRALGAEVHEIDLGDAAEARSFNTLMTTADAAAYHYDDLRDRRDLFGADVLTRMEGGARFTSTEYALARRFQAVWRRRLESLFQQYDLLLTAATPVTAPVRAGADAVAVAPTFTRFTAPFNLGGVPALALPGGFAEGLPIGLQLVGPDWSEARVLRAGYAYEQATEWHTKRPANM